ncbi:MAG: nucleotidyltransferase family protein, partial [Fimbriimonadales bacterium]|nr:nucleotidyltransferase family protein [Fimbriimonadales bacterium]
RLRARYPIKRLALFGSFARNEATPESDIDVMVEFDRRIGWEIVDLKEELEHLLGRRVDLATLNALRRKPLLWQSVQEDLLDVEAEC